jgi:hypothetical protein
VIQTSLDHPQIQRLPSNLNRHGTRGSKSKNPHKRVFATSSRMDKEEGEQKPSLKSKNSNLTPRLLQSVELVLVSNIDEGELWCERKVRAFVSSLVNN